MQFLKKRLYELTRFGLTPEKLAHRFLYGREHLHPIITISIPKSGTNLLQRILLLNPFLYRALTPTLGPRNKHKWMGLDNALSGLGPGQILSTHVDHTQEREEAIERFGVRALFLTRDPRDILVSDMHYIMRRRDHTHHSLFHSLTTDKDRLRLAIAGNTDLGVPNIEDQFARFVGWSKSRALLVRFENIIGPAGGGSARTQEENIKRIYEHVGIELPRSELRLICQATHSNLTKTFRKGTVGDWRNYFDDELNDLYRHTAGESVFKMTTPEAP